MGSLAVVEISLHEPQLRPYRAMTMAAEETAWLLLLLLRLLLPRFLRSIVSGEMTRRRPKVAY